jgi:hypothetical protein
MELDRKLGTGQKYFFVVWIENSGGNSGTGLLQQNSTSHKKFQRFVHEISACNLISWEIHVQGG